MGSTCLGQFLSLKNKRGKPHSRTAASQQSSSPTSHVLSAQKRVFAFFFPQGLRGRIKFHSSDNVAQLQVSLFVFHHSGSSEVLSFYSYLHSILH